MTPEIPETPLELVSAVIPCYKQAHFLGEAIESVLAQTFPAHEIIVVDDGSPDGTEEVAIRYSSVRYVRQANQGLSAARNTGYRHSRGAFIVFLDADDRLLPNHFLTCLEAFQQKPDAAFVCGDYRFLGDEEAVHVHDCRPQPDLYGTLLRSNFIGPPHTVMFRRDVIARAGGFREGLKSCEDQDIYLRIARTAPIYCHHEKIAEYRRHMNQMSQKWEVMLSTAMEILSKQRRYVRKHPEYKKAWEAGVLFRKNLYGPALAWTTVSTIKSKDWARALRCLYVMLRWYPQGLTMLMQHKSARKYEAIG